MKKRIWSVLLTLALIFTMLPMSVSANDKDTVGARI